MIDVNKGVTKPHHNIRLSRGAGSDSMICFLEKKTLTGDHFSWVTFGKHPRPLELYTDALFRRHWKTYNIAILGVTYGRCKCHVFL